MGKIIETIKKSIFEEEKEEASLSGVLQVFWTILIYLFLVPLFFVHTYLGWWIIKKGMFLIWGDMSASFYQQVSWIVYGLLIGLIASMFVQSIQKQRQSPSDLAKILIHHFGHFIAILTALGIWVIIIWIITR